MCFLALFSKPLLLRSKVILPPQATPGAAFVGEANPVGVSTFEFFQLFPFVGIHPEHIIFTFLTFEQHGVHPQTSLN